MSNSEHTPEIAAAMEKHRREALVFRYLGILFGAAFCLLLLTFMMERRNSNAEINDLVSHRDTINETLHETRATADDLRDALTYAQHAIADLEEDLADAEELIEVAEESADDLRIATETLYIIESLYEAGDLENALATIERFELTSAYKLLLTQTAPIQPIADETSAETLEPLPSPAEQYAQLRALLVIED